MNLNPRFVVISALLAANPFALGQTEESPREVPELVTNRPDQTESSVVVPVGSVQLETGWGFSRNGENGVRLATHQFPGTLARIGVVNRLEFRVGSSGGIWESTREAGERSSTSGGGDMDIGAKLYLWEEQGWLPESALLVGLSLPVGSKGFSSETSDPSFRMSLSHTLGNRFSLGYNLGASRESLPEDGSSFESLSVFNYTAVLGMGVTDRLGAFVEFFGDIPFRAQEPASHLFDGGITFLVWKNLQLDTSFGVGLSESAEDWFAGAGVSFRLPR